MSLAILAGLLMGGGCSVVKGPTGETMDATCVLLVDRTASTNAATTLVGFRNEALATVQGCRQAHARMSIFTFDQADVTLVGGGTFDLWRGKSRKASTAQRALDGRVSAASTAVTSVLQPQGGARPGSNILAALGQAAVAFREPPAKRYLVVLTDGLQRSQSISVDALSGPTVPTKPLVDEVRRSSLIPALPGVQVDMIGPADRVLNRQDQAIGDWFPKMLKDVWRQIFLLANASHLCYGQEAASLPSPPVVACTTTTP